jgi:hypothetical protein
MTTGRINQVAFITLAALGRVFRFGIPRYRAFTLP